MALDEFRSLAFFIMYARAVPVSRDELIPHKENHDKYRPCFNPT